MRKTKIVATIGPKSANYETLKNLILNGTNIVRINMSHGCIEEYQKTIDLVKQIREEFALPVGIMMDTRGPEVRVKKFENDKIELTPGQTFSFVKEDVLGTENYSSITENAVLDIINVGNIILLNDGLVKLEVIEVNFDKVTCKVIEGGIVSNNKSIAFPGIQLNLPYLNDRDKEGILFSIKNNVEYIAASFVNSKEDVKILRAYIKEHGGDIEIISKIESACGLNNLDEIIEESDGIMVARGDLGVEIPLEKVPEFQKIIIKKSITNGKMVITATEMLESMTYSPRPTRAETSDVANAVFDGTSDLMLSGETAIGLYPVETVQTMAKIAIEAENNVNFHDNFISTDYQIKTSTDAVTHALVQSSFLLPDIKAIAVYTHTGYTARMVSRFRPSVPIVALTPSVTTFNRLALSWGVIPILTNRYNNTDEMFDLINNELKTKGYAKPEDLVLIARVSGKTKPFNDMLKIHTIR